MPMTQPNFYSKKVNDFDPYKNINSVEADGASNKNIVNTNSAQNK